MAKPRPIPELRGPDAIRFNEKIKRPRATQAVKKLYRGSMRELEASEAAESSTNKRA